MNPMGAQRKSDYALVLNPAEEALLAAGEMDDLLKLVRKRTGWDIDRAAWEINGHAMRVGLMYEGVVSVLTDPLPERVPQAATTDEVVDAVRRCLAQTPRELWSVYAVEGRLIFMARRKVMNEQTAKEE